LISATLARSLAINPATTPLLLQKKERNSGGTLRQRCLLKFLLCMHNLGHLVFFNIIITYLNYKLISYIGKIPEPGTPSNKGLIFEHITNLDEVRIFAMISESGTKPTASQHLVSYLHSDILQNIIIRVLENDGNQASCL
jgi:hypothetical protein